MKHLRTKNYILLIATLVLSACGDSNAQNNLPNKEHDNTEPAVVESLIEEPAAEEHVAENLTDLFCEEPINVGLITDASGPLANHGAHIIRSFMLGMEYAAGVAGSAGDVFDFTFVQENTFNFQACEIQVFVRDDQSNPEKTATIAHELIDVHDVDILIGSVSSRATATLQDLAFENKVPLIVAPASANDITGKNFNEYTFRTSRNNYQDAINVCSYFVRHYDSFVQIAPDYEFGWRLASAFRDACSFEGAAFLGDDIFAPSDTTDFTPYIEQVLNSGAEAYIVTWAPGGFSSLTQVSIDLGVNEAMALGTTFIDNMLMPLWFDNAVGSTNGINYHYSAPDNSANDFLTEQDLARYGTAPDRFDADGMNAAIMVAKAIRATNGNVNSEALVAAMEGMTFEGPKGMIYIRPEDHVAIQDMYILKLVDLDAANAAYYEYVETTRPEPPCLLPPGLQDRCGDLLVGSLSGD
jgi:branched-chain amino acid transport system substrate-binding protein